MRFFYTPNDHSPTYELESDGNRRFVRILNIYELPPECSSTNKKLPITVHHEAYFHGDGWAKVLRQRDWLGLQT